MRVAKIRDGHSGFIYPPLKNYMFVMINQWPRYNLSDVFILRYLCGGEYRKRYIYIYKSYFKKTMLMMWVIIGQHFSSELKANKLAKRGKK